MTMTPRVLYLHEFSRIGGAELALVRLIEAIRPTGVEPLVAWPRNDAIFARLLSQGIRVVRLKVPAWRRGLSLPLLPLCLFRLRAVLSRGGVDLVHVNNYRSVPFGRLAARWAGVPCVSTVRETIAPHKIRQYGLRELDALVAVCDSVARVLVEAGVPQGRVATVRSGVPLPPMPTASARRKLRESLGGAADDPTIGIVAHILPHKGFDDLVQALSLIVRKIPRVRCLVVGEAPRKKYLDHLLDLAERLAVRDRLVWVGAQEDVPRFLAAMDLFVLPSHTEGLPLTILEAMAAGRPVVGTAVGGIPEAVRHGETGFVVPPRDSRRLAEAVIDVLANPTLAKSMGEAGRASVRDTFTLEAEARHTYAQYCRVLGARCELPTPGAMEPRA